MSKKGPELGIIDPKSGRFHAHLNGDAASVLATGVAHATKEGAPVKLGQRDPVSGRVTVTGTVRPPASNQAARETA